MPPLPPFALERYLARYEFAVKHLLCGSDCEAMTVDELLAYEPSARDAFSQQWLGYTESQGAPALREQIAGLYSTISPADILVHAGAEEAIYLFIHAALQPGDHLIVHWPCYQSLHEVARSLGCQVTRWEASPVDWSLDIDQLAGLIQPNTKVIVINTPHNPTGYLMPRDRFEALAELCDRRGILLFSDEVYRESEYDPAERLPSTCDLHPQFVSLGVMSKTYGLPGLRIGWVATRNRTLLRRMQELKDYTTICNSAPSEFLATLALRHRHRIVERNLSIIGRNLPLLDAFMKRYSELFVWRRPRAGAIGYPVLRHGSIEQFADAAVREQGVLILPGTVYGDSGGGFRVGFGRRNFPQALQQFELFATQWLARPARSLESVAS